MSLYLAYFLGKNVFLIFAIYTLLPFDYRLATIPALHFGTGHLSTKLKPRTGCSHLPNMEALTSSVQLRAGNWRSHQRASPICRSGCTRTSRARTYAGDSIKETYTNIGKKKFDLNNTSWRKGGMESEKVDGPVTRLWKFFFRPNEGYVDRYGFSVPMGPLDDVSTSIFVTIHVSFGDAFTYG